MGEKGLEPGPDSIIIPEKTAGRERLERSSRATADAIHRQFEALDANKFWKLHAALRISLSRNAEKPPSDPGRAELNPDGMPDPELVAFINGWDENSRKWDPFVFSRAVSAIFARTWQRERKKRKKD